MDFKDHFSKQASKYSKYRPVYPAELYEYLASLVSSHKTAWDCATGSGQAALGLVPYFDKIIATDASEKQVSNAIKHEKITYAVCPSENTNIPKNSVDLIVVSQALHWLDHKKFNVEVQRVLKPGGIIAVWCYDLLRIFPEIDDIIDAFSAETVGPFWPPERKQVDENYKNIPFPFEKLPVREFQMEAFWSLDHLIGYLGTWSSVQKFKDKNKFDPVENIKENLCHFWGNPKHERKVCWPIHLQIGKLKDG